VSRAIASTRVSLRRVVEYPRLWSSGVRFRLTQVLIHQDGGWRIGGLHLSPLADQPAPPS
jgi:hypothetical protein